MHRYALYRYTREVMCGKDLGLIFRCSCVEQTIFHILWSLFAFAKANLHDNNVIVFGYFADRDVSRAIHHWVRTKDFYVAEDWFGMNDLDFKSPMNSSEFFFFSSSFFRTFVFCMHVFLTPSCTFQTNLQILHQGLCAERIRFESPYLRLRGHELQSQERWLAQQLHI